MGVKAWKLGMVCTVVAASLAVATTANAISANIHIHGTGSDGVLMHSAPTTSSTRVGWMGEGTSPDYQCFAYGDSVSGDNVWFYVVHSGIAGYYASYWDDSSFHSEAELTSKYGIPKCGAPAPPPAPTPQPTPSPPPAPAPAPSISAAIGGQYGCGDCSALNIAVHDFPTGTYTYECHDNSGPGGGDKMFYSHAVAVSDPNQSSWPGVFCDDNAPYTAYLVMNGVRSNAVTFSGGVSQAGAPSDVVDTPAAGGGGATGSGSQGTVATAPSTGGFDRAATVSWARLHAQDRPFDGTSCTWFISQALWQGGLAKTATWTSDGTHGHIRREPGTTTAFYTPKFVRYILNAYPRSTYRMLHFGPTGNRIPEAQAGDVITYDWDGDSAGGNLDGLDHAALITRIDASGYPLVSEWSVDGRSKTPYTERGWTWSKLHGTYLAKYYPRIRAFILHIDTRHL